MALLIKIREILPQVVRIVLYDQSLLTLVQEPGATAYDPAFTVEDVALLRHLDIRCMAAEEARKYLFSVGFLWLANVCDDPGK